MEAPGDHWKSRLRDPRWVLLLALVLFGWNLWAYDLWAPDEPFFGEGAREMIVDGHWLVTHVNGEINTHKPPLFFWLIALFSLPFGEISSLTARLPSALAALGSLYLTMRWARRWCGGRTAVLAGVILATTHMFWEKARSAQIDSLLCFLILISLSAFESFRAGELPGRRAGILFWTAAAAAVLAKGPVGLLLPLGIALVTLAVDRQLPRWRSFAPFAGPLAFAAVAGLWVAAVSLWGAEGYSVWGALREHFVERAVHGMHHVQPPWYYLGVLPYALLPWSFLLPGGLWLAFRRRRSDDRFLLVIALFVVIFFSISTEKRDLYILPAVPAFALLSARLVAAVLGWWPPREERDAPSPARRWVTVPQGFVGGVIVLAAAAVPFVAPRFGPEIFAAGIPLAVVLGIGGLGIVVTAVRGRVLPTVRWTAATMALGMLVAVSLVYPALNPQKSGRELALVVRDETAASRAAGFPVLALGLDNIPNSINFYSDGVYLQEVSSREEILRILENGGATHLLAKASDLPPFPEELERHKEVVYSTHLARRDVVILHFDR